MPRREPESRNDSPISTRKGGGLTIEAGPEPLKWTIEPISSVSGVDDCEGAKPKPVRLSPARCPESRWPPGRSSDSTLVWPQTGPQATARIKPRETVTARIALLIRPRVFFECHSSFRVYDVARAGQATVWITWSAGDTCPDLPFASRKVFNAENNLSRSERQQ